MNHLRSRFACMGLAALFLGCPEPSDSPGGGGGGGGTPSGDTVRGSLFYQARFPSVAGGGISLDRVETLPAVGAAAVVQDAGGEVIGIAQVDGDGNFEVPLQKGLAGGEQVVFATLWAPTLESSGISLAVLQPPVDGPGTYEPGSATSPPWTWVAEVPDGGDLGRLEIREEQGSGALYLFLFLIAAQAAVLEDLCNGDEACLVSVGILWSPGVNWTCGACYSRGTPQQIENGPTMQQSIFLAGGAQESSAWGFTVTLHEFGHSVAANYSRDDSPGGPHGFGQVIAPAFAWSEGWASFFAVSTFSRWIGEPFPVYWDIQEGNSLWIDYDRMTYFGGDLVRPDPGAGMAQNLDESYVVSMLWHLWDGAEVAEGEAWNDGVAIGTDPVLRAFGSERMTQWDRGAQGADFVDFLDALLCRDGGLLASVTGMVTEGLGFPYDGQPGCP